MKGEKRARAPETVPTSDRCVSIYYVGDDGLGGGETWFGDVKEDRFQEVRC